MRNLIGPVSRLYLPHCLWGQAVSPLFKAKKKSDSRRSSYSPYTIVKYTIYAAIWMYLYLIRCYKQILNVL